MNVFIILGIVVLLVVVWFFARVPRPQVPPLVVDINDPKMVQAKLKARATLDKFKIHLVEYPNAMQQEENQFY